MAPNLSLPLDSRPSPGPSPSANFVSPPSPASAKAPPPLLADHLHSWLAQRKAVNSEVFYPSVPGDLVVEGMGAFSSDSNSDPSALLSVSHRVWRSAMSMARVGVDLGRVYNITGVLIFWWDRSWAETFQIESSLTGSEWSVVADQQQFVSVYEVNRVSVCGLTDKRCRYLRISMKNGHIDSHFKRYMFGIGKITVLGEVFRSQSDSSLLGNSGKGSVSLEVPEEETFEERMQKEKARSSVKWLALCQTSAHPWRESESFTSSSWTQMTHRTPYLLRPNSIFRLTDNHFLSRSTRRNYHLHFSDPSKVIVKGDPRNRFWPPPEVAVDSLARVVTVASRAASALPLVSRTGSAGVESVMIESVNKSASSKSSRASRRAVSTPHSQ